MKRESDLIQKLLVKLEEFPARPGEIFLFHGSEPELAIDGYSSDQIEYHLMLLEREGYIDSPGSQPMQGVTFRGITPHGHDYLDQSREIVRKRETEEAAAESQKWISAAEAVRLLKPIFNSDYLAQMTICKRAHGGLIRARAERFLTDKKEGFEIPKGFWWAEGNTALNQNWPAGDFDTWIDRGEVHLQAFGVSFFHPDINKLIPAGSAQPVPPPPSPSVGGRPPADWWEDLLIEICFQHFRGDLKPKVQADVERAMQDWILKNGYEAAPSTVRTRARKVWQAIKSEAEK
jgi:hypothetical protein